MVELHYIFVFIFSLCFHIFHNAIYNHKIRLKLNRCPNIESNEAIFKKTLKFVISVHTLEQHLISTPDKLVILAYLLLLADVKKNFMLVDAPVSGGVKRAADGTLTV